MIDVNAYGSRMARNIPEACPPPVIGPSPATVVEALETGEQGGIDDG